MRREEVVGLARIVLSSRERPFLIEPMEKGFIGFTLRFAHDERGAEDYFADIPNMKFPGEMMKLAQHINKSKLGEFDGSLLQDHYRTALGRILKKKQAKHPASQPLPVKPLPENVVNLMDALRRSIAAERPEPPQRPKVVNAARIGSASLDRWKAYSHVQLLMRMQWTRLQASSAASLRHRSAKPAVNSDQKTLRRDRNEY